MILNNSRKIKFTRLQPRRRNRKAQMLVAVQQQIHLRSLEILENPGRWCLKLKKILVLLSNVCFDGSHPSKKGFLERIGIHRRKRVNDDRDADRSKQDVPKTTISTAIDQDDNASDGSIDTSTSSASDLPRKSAESSRSVGLHSLANPRGKEGYVPHGGIPVKVSRFTLLQEWIKFLSDEGCIG